MSEDNKGQFKQDTLLEYQKLLEVLEESQENHLLLGNGFNLSLSITTDYKSIFKKMKEEYRGYEDLESLFENECESDIEKLLGKIKEKLECNKREPETNHVGINDFLKKYTHNKIKLDFMKATYSIVNEKIKYIYNEKNEKIHLLLKNFTNYFTLNYDPSLYLLLMKFKKNNNLTAGVFQNTLNFKQKTLDTEKNSIYTKIKKAYKDGSLEFSGIEGELNKKIPLKNLKKNYFTETIKKYAKQTLWNCKDKDIKEAIDLLWDYRNNKQKLEQINDGFQGNVFKGNYYQNLFFLHGAFHIYIDTKGIKKITQTADKAFFENLEKIIDSENKDILCIFESEDKKEQIKESNYLKIASQKLATLEGSMVILGSSLSENDNHIFKAINESRIENIYLSTSEEEINQDSKKAQNYFSKKKRFFFDYKSISYE